MYPGSKQQFARDLYAAYPTVGEVQKNIYGRGRGYFRASPWGDRRGSRHRPKGGSQSYLMNGIPPAIEISYDAARRVGFQDHEVEQAAKALKVSPERFGSRCGSRNC